MSLLDQDLANEISTTLHVPHPQRKLTVVELVATLCNSGKLNIVVEGDDDIIIYRELVERIGIDKVDLHQAGGRTPLLQVYEKLAQYRTKSTFNHMPVAFIADKDMWLFRGIPDQYKDIIWTEGYSIENDLYSSANLRRFVTDPQYPKRLNSFIVWFASKVEEYLIKNPHPPRSYRDEDEDGVELDIHCTRIVPPGQTKLHSTYSSLSPMSSTVTEIQEAYNSKLRGKHLFCLLVSSLMRPAPGLGFADADFNEETIYTIAVPMADSLFSRLEKEVKDKLGLLS